MEVKLYVNARFVTQTLTGVQRYAFEISKQLLLLYPTIEFLQPVQPKQPWAESLPTTQLGKHRGTIWEQWDLVRYFKKQPQAVLLNLCNTAPLSYSNQWICLHDLAFIHFPNSFSYAFRTWYGWLIPKIVQQSKGIFTVSETIRQEIIKTYQINSAKITVAGNGIPSFPKTSYPKEKWLLSVGSLTGRKQTDKLIHAFLQCDELAEYTLIHVGSSMTIFNSPELPSHPRLKRYANLTDDALIELYAKSELFISYSAYEGFGLPVAEAIHFGCKVLCADIPVYRELFSEYVYFCATQEQSLKQALAHMPQQILPDLTSFYEKFSYAQSASIILEKINE
ncbi:MAG: glycosyltransferase family 4 protein [Chitinophagaceae bacterium]|nr:glycosyltransferase family 4 protein [Chitinophagaceae bacterium]